MDPNLMNPLRQLGQMGEQMQKMFGDDFMKKIMSSVPGGQGMPTIPEIPGMNWNSSLQGPRIDLYQTKNELIAVMEIPGLERSADVKVSVEPYRLYVRGNYAIRYSSVAQDQFVLYERQRGSFEREITLPVRVLANKARASYRQGLLEIHMIKDEASSRGMPKGNYIPVDFE